jgi:hypothetical protein
MEGMSDINLGMTIHSYRDQQSLGSRGKSFQPRRGDRVKPGASAPGQGGEAISTAPKGRHRSRVAPSGLPILMIITRFLGLTPQALLGRPFGARKRNFSVAETAFFTKTQLFAHAFPARQRSTKRR